MRMRWIHFPLLCLLAACSATGQKQPTAEAAFSESLGSLATVNGASITEQDLDVRAELIQLEQQIYQVKMQALDEAIADRLIEAEAEKRGV